MKLLNSAVITQEGMYFSRKITKDQFIQIVQQYHAANDLENYVGYKQNIDLLEKWTGIKFELSRDAMTLSPSDELIVMKLKYRTTDPANKGLYVNEEDFEFLIIKYNA